MSFIQLESVEMSDAPVTQSDWMLLMGDNPSYFKLSPSHPVEMVSYDDCLKYIEQLNKNQNDFTYRLPTEQEWELAAKSCDEQEIYEIAWCWENSAKSTRPVRTKKPNALGFYDMLGNVWEWTASREGSGRVLRGGSWVNNAQSLRACYRYYWRPSYRNFNVGFRLVRTPKHSTTPADTKALRALAVAQKALGKIEEILKDDES